MVWFIVFFVGLLVVLLIALWRRERNSRGNPEGPFTDVRRTQPPPGEFY